MVAEEDRPRPDGSRFRVIPVLLRPSGGFPFLQTRFVVDFRDPVDYDRRLIELVRGLRGQPAPPDAKLDAPFEPPPELPQPATVAKAQVRGVFAGMFDSLDDNGIVTLFTQEAMGLGATDLLLAQARDVMPPARSCTRADDLHGREAAGYFANLGGQLELGEGLTTSGAIAAQLPGSSGGAAAGADPQRVREWPRCRAPRISQPACAASMQRIATRCRIVLRGGEKLAGLKFEDGDISMLAIAASCYWPELTVADVTRLYAQRNVGRALHEDVGQAILTLTGGEPRMVGHCVRRLGELDEADVPGDAARLQTMAGDLLADCELGHQLFMMPGLPTPPSR